MNKSVFFLSLLIIIALCQVNSKNKLRDLSTKLIQMNQAAGKDNNDCDVLAGQLDVAMKNYFKGFREQINDTREKFKEGVEIYNGFITNLNADQLSTVAEGNKENDALAVAKNTLDAQNAALKEANESRARIAARAVKANDEFTVNTSEANEKKVVLRQLANILTDELLTPEEPAKSFIQIKGFQENINKLQALIKNSKNSKFSPLLSTLIQVTLNKNFADQGIIRKILDLLNKISKDLDEFIERTTKEHVELLKHLNEEMTNKTKEQEAISVLVAQARSDIAYNEHGIKLAAEATERIKGQLHRAESELDMWNSTSAHFDKVEEHVNEEEKKGENQ